MLIITVIGIGSKNNRKLSLVPASLTQNGAILNFR